MKQRTYLFLFSILSLSSAIGQSYSVNFFLAEECKISQFYTNKMQALHEQFSSEHMTFGAYFPNPSSTQEKIDEWAAKYEISFPLQLDTRQTIVRQWHVKVTPEVVVWDKETEQILYQGRIDNSYFKVGQRRTVTTTNELEEVLLALTNGEAVEPAQTTPIGCFISMARTGPCCTEGKDGRCSVH